MPPLMADADKGDQDAVVFVRTGPVDDTDGRFVAMRISGQGYWLEDDKTGPLRARDGKDHGAAVIAWTQDGVNADPLMVREGSTYTQEGKVFHMHNVVQVSMDQAMVFDGAQITHPANMTRVSPGGMVSTLAATSKMRVALGDGVRRLTPVEAERLQGFDDGWTDVVVGKKPMADTHRYRLMGNAVNVPVFEWVARRLPV